MAGLCTNKAEGGDGDWIASGVAYGNSRKKNEEKGKTVEIIFLNQFIRVSLTDFHPIATESFYDLSAIKTYLVFNYDHV